MKFKPLKHHSFIASLESATPYNLSDSCCESLTLAELLALSGEALPIGCALHYASIPGHPELRRAIAELYSAYPSGDNVGSEQVSVFCGAQEALFAVFHAVLEAGDEVIVPTPCYPSLIEMPSLLGAKAIPLPLEFERGWQLAIGAFEQRITSRTKLIVINSPHNPTGALATAEFATELLNLARSENIYLIADDVSIFSDFNRIGITHPYLAYEKTVAIGVLSKSFGLAGVRIGWAITPNETVRHDLMTVKTYMSICPSVLDENLALTAINHFASIAERNNAIIRRNVEAFESFLAETGSAFAWHRPQAGIMTLVKSNLDIPLQNFARSLAKDCGILMLPGDLFSMNGNFFRLGLGRMNLPDVLTRLKSRLAEM